MAPPLIDFIIRPEITLVTTSLLAPFAAYLKYQRRFIAPVVLPSWLSLKMIKENIMKKLMIFAVLCVGGVVGYFAMNAMFSSGEIEKAQQEAAAQINKNLPMQVDELTTLEAVSSEGSALVYNYKVDVKKDETDLDVFTAEVKKNLMATMCGKEPFSKLYSAGASYVYNYTDTAGDALTEITIDADTCKS
jgi:hypothetical protein